MLFRNTNKEKNNDKSTEQSPNAEHAAIKLLAEPLTKLLNTEYQGLIAKINLQAFRKEIYMMIQEPIQTREKLKELFFDIRRYMSDYLMDLKQPDLAKVLNELNQTVEVILGTTLSQQDAGALDKRLTNDIDKLKETLAIQTAKRERAIGLEAIQDFYKASQPTSCVIL